MLENLKPFYDQFNSLCSPAIQKQHFDGFNLSLQKLASDNNSEALLTWFTESVISYLNNNSDSAPSFFDLKPLQQGDCAILNDLSAEYTELGLSQLNSTAMIKLNGGLGTSMGCSGPKSLVPIHRSDTFMDKIQQQHRSIEQRYDASIPLLIMNSFYTEDAMKQSSYKGISFIQHRIPRLLAQSATPYSAQGSQSEWSPPGHGNIFLSLYTSGQLDQLIEKGISYAFISNSDNLGATLDPTLLGYIHKHSFDFLMEVTPKTIHDVKGGALTRCNDHYYLLERAQVPDEQISEFEDISRFYYFNTNNLWVNLHSLKKRILANSLKLPLIFNHKSIDGTAVVQLETAMGSAISLFDNSSVIHVDRQRFFPVKTTSDLLLLQSDIVEKRKDGTVHWKNPDAIPHIRLESPHTDIEMFSTLVSVTPDITELQSLHVKGPVKFDSSISLKGTVSISASGNSPVSVPHTRIENQSLNL